jgi:thiol-disulfide isomerase/thioredoxin
MNRRHLVFGACALAALAAAGEGYRRLHKALPVDTAQATRDSSVLLNRSLPDPDGKPHALSAWKGQVMVVNFWATWCGPCVHEMPQLDALQKTYPSVRFVGIGIDSADNIRAYLGKVQVSYPLLVMDTGGSDLIRQLGNAPGGLPFTVILAEDGSISRKILGRIDSSDVAHTLSILTRAA